MGSSGILPLPEKKPTETSLVSPKKFLDDAPVSKTKRGQGLTPEELDKITADVIAKLEQDAEQGMQATRRGKRPAEENTDRDMSVKRRYQENKENIDPDVPATRRGKRPAEEDTDRAMYAETMGKRRAQELIGKFKDSPDPYYEIIDSLTDYSGTLEDRFREEASQIEGTNEQLRSLISISSKVRAAEPAGADVTTPLTEDQKKQVLALAKDFEAVGITLDKSKINTLGDLQSLVNTLDSRKDQLSSFQQKNTITVQRLSNTIQQSYELISNLLNQLKQMISNIISNMR